MLIIAYYKQLLQNHLTYEYALYIHICKIYAIEIIHTTFNILSTI